MAGDGYSNIHIRLVKFLHHQVGKRKCVRKIFVLVDLAIVCPDHLKADISRFNLIPNTLPHPSPAVCFLG